MEDLERKLEQLLKDPNNPELFNCIGVILYEVKDLKNAEMYFQRAYELNPLNSDILYNYASLLYVREQFRKAAPIYEAYLKFYKDDEVVHRIGDCYYQLGEYELAGKMYEQLQKM